MSTPTSTDVFTLTLALAGVMAGLGRRARADDVTIGVVFSWVLGIGVLLIAVLSTGSSGGSGLIVANTLFGSIFGLSAGQGVVAAAIGVGVALAALAIATLARAPRSRSQSTRSCRAASAEIARRKEAVLHLIRATRRDWQWLT